jgi:hypothetical protein
MAQRALASYSQITEGSRILTVVTHARNKGVHFTWEELSSIHWQLVRTGNLGHAARLERDIGAGLFGPDCTHTYTERRELAWEKAGFRASLSRVCVNLGKNVNFSFPEVPHSHLSGLVCDLTIQGIRKTWSASGRTRIGAKNKCAKEALLYLSQHGMIHDHTLTRAVLSGMLQWIAPAKLWRFAPCLDDEYAASHMDIARLIRLSLKRAPAGEYVVRRIRKANDETEADLDDPNVNMERERSNLSREKGTGGDVKEQTDKKQRNDTHAGMEEDSSGLPAEVLRQIDGTVSARSESHGHTGADGDESSTPRNRLDGQNFRQSHVSYASQAQTSANQQQCVRSMVQHARVNHDAYLDSGRNHTYSSIDAYIDSKAAFTGVRKGGIGYDDGYGMEMNNGRMHATHRSTHTMAGNENIGVNEPDNGIDLLDANMYAANEGDITVSTQAKDVDWSKPRSQVIDWRSALRGFVAFRHMDGALEGMCPAHVYVCLCTHVRLFKMESMFCFS